MGRALPSLVLVILCLAAHTPRPGRAQDYTFPGSEYEYSLRRDWLLEKEAEFESLDVQLLPDEQVVDHYMGYLKWLEFQKTKDIGFPPFRPVEEMLDNITASDVYRVMKKLPKGGNMHAHENHQLSKKTLLNIIWNSTEFSHLYMLPEDHPTRPWTLDFFIAPPVGEDWIRVMDNATLTKEYIYSHQIFFGVLSDEAKRYPSDTGLRWRDLNALWDRGSTQLIANIVIKEKYLNALMQEGMDENFQYLEYRKHFGPAEMLYELVDSPEYAETNGKHFLDDTGELELNMTIRLVEEFKNANPRFIGFNRITYMTRFSSNADVAAYFDRALYLYGLFPQHLKGLDLVAEEDSGKSHLYFLENFLDLFDPETKQSRIPLYLHTAETNWPDDLITSSHSDDPVATSQNTYEALLLGAPRVGHGLGFSKHPYLIQEMKARGVAAEVCPVSNQLLGFYPDVRVHPGISYLKQGVPIVLGADDPGTFGYDSFTVDWYQIYMAWGIGLVELKQISHNALVYSAMTSAEKDEAITQKWQPAWDDFILEVKAEACSASLAENDPVFDRLLPRDGAVVDSTNVHVFGRHFESAICSGVKCRFGAEMSPSAGYISNNHVICASPPGTLDLTVGVEVSLDNGTIYIETGLNFTYSHETITTTTTTTTTQAPVEPCSSGVSEFAAVHILCLLAMSILAKVTSIV